MVSFYFIWDLNAFYGLGTRRTVETLSLRGGTTTYCSGTVHSEERVRGDRLPREQGNWRWRDPSPG